METLTDTLKRFKMQWSADVKTTYLRVSANELTDENTFVEREERLYLRNLKDLQLELRNHNIEKLPWTLNGEELWLYFQYVDEKWMVKPPKPN
jgi:hypothetical protein